MSLKCIEIPVSQDGEYPTPPNTHKAPSLASHIHPASLGPGILFGSGTPISP